MSDPTPPTADSPIEPGDVSADAMTEPVVEAVTKSMTERDAPAVTEPVVEPVVQPVTESVTEPSVDSAAASLPTEPDDATLRRRTQEEHEAAKAAPNPTETVVPAPGMLSAPAVVPTPSKGSTARLALTLGCAVLGVLTVFLVNRNYRAPATQVPTGPAPVAAQAPSPANPPENTVVAPLAPVVFTPGPPEPPADLAIYRSELISAARPYVDIAPTGIVENPEMWSSHFYGPSDLPASQTPPIDAGNEALCMVAQINLADLPDLPKPDKETSGPIHRFPKGGVLQFWLAMAPAGSPTGWTGGPTFHDTVNQAAQRVTYISEADMATAGAKTIPQSSRCSDGPPARGAAVPLGINFSVQWHVPETTDSRFSSAMPYLAGALGAADPSEFYRALGSINGYLGSDGGAQLGGFNRLVEQDPRSIDALAGEGARDGRVTDLFEVLLEIHTTQDADDAWAIGFGSQGSGGWWVDPQTLGSLNASGQIPSAFWWDSQPVPVEEETQDGN